MTIGRFNRILSDAVITVKPITDLDPKINYATTMHLSMSSPTIVSFPDPAFKLDKGLAHFARNLGLPDLAGKE